MISKDWDILIILDACRCDYFKRKNPFPESVECVISKGENTPRWLQRNFYDKRIHDTVYVTTSPFATSIPDNTFHDVKYVGLDREFGREPIHPKLVSERAESIAKNHQDKRIIIHYLQPHAPFIGEYGQTLPHFDGDNQSIWSHLRYGTKSVNLMDIQKAYAENLDLVLSHVQEIVPRLKGKVVISSDHGELIGEILHPIPIRGYEHPWGVRHPKQVNVPWLELPSAERREIRTERPTHIEQPDRDIVEDRLFYLGYSE